MAAIGSTTFGGLITGLDTNKIIDDLITVDSKPLERLETRRTDLTEKRDTFTTMKSNLLELKNTVSELKTAPTFGVFSASSSDEEALTVTASISASEGNYSMRILSLAKAETLSGNSYESTDTELGLSGEILVNNEILKIRATDSLIDIRNGINSLNANVTASILKVTTTDNRLIIASSTSGAGGFLISNVGENDILGGLGITDGTKKVREVVSGQVLSAGFNSAHSTIGSLLGISSEAAGTVNIRNTSFSIDLASDTLTTIRDKINGLGLSGVSASVESVTTDGETTYKLAITGTQEFTDDGNVLETLGILEGGTSGTYTEFQTGVLSYVNDGSETVTVHTTLILLGAEINETVTISGTNIDGSSVSRTINITDDTTVEDVLSSIEEAYDNNVTAALQDGRITVRSNVEGSNSLTFSIDTMNEYGGILDFGTVSTVTRGRDRLLVEGTDAKILMNNIEVSRDTNEINDVLTGLTLALKKADPDTEITITVERDRQAIYNRIENFVKSYNDFVDFVEENSRYDEEKDTAGPLLGDLTTRTVLSRIRNALQSTVYDSDFAYNQLVQIGIQSTTDGKLNIDTSKLNKAISDDIDSVISLFTATRTSSDNDIWFVYHSNKSKPGTYDVAISSAAERAEVLSDMIVNEVGESGIITITDNFESTMNLAYTEDMRVEDIANSINEEAQETYAAILQSDAALKQTGGIESITQNTEIGDIEGVTVNEGDTITIKGTTRTGNSFQRVLTVSGEDGTTVEDILDIIESVNDYKVNASVDTEGRIRVEDKTSGKSEISLVVETTIGGLDFGMFDTVQQGRNVLTVEAEVTDDNRLRISHTNYGSKNSFTISGASGIGIQDGEYQGIDVAGTINGIEGTGSGQALTAANDDENTRGIVIRTTITPEELEEEGQNQGTITLISGVADMLYNELTSLTDPVSGFVQAKIDNFERSLDSLQSQITNVNKRLEMRRARYVQKFTELERAIARLQSLQERLSASLANLQTTGLFTTSL